MNKTALHTSLISREVRIKRSHYTWLPLIRDALSLTFTVTSLFLFDHDGSHNYEDAREPLMDGWEGCIY